MLVVEHNQVTSLCFDFSKLIELDRLVSFVDHGVAFSEHIFPVLTESIDLSLIAITVFTEYAVVLVQPDTYFANYFGDLDDDHVTITTTPINLLEPHV